MLIRRNAVAAPYRPLFLVAPRGAGLGALYGLAAAARPVALLNEAGRSAMHDYVANAAKDGESQATAASLQDIFSEHATQRGARCSRRGVRLVSAAAGMLRHVGALAEAFPQAQFVYLHRDPQQIRPQLRRQWAQETQAGLQALQALASDRWCALVRHDLLIDPTDEAYWLGEFAGLKWNRVPALQGYDHAGANAALPVDAAVQAIYEEASRLCQSRHPAWGLLSQPKMAKSPARVAGLTARTAVQHRLAASLCLGAAVLPTVAHAASFTVSNLNDSGTGSLRDAVTQANATVGVPDTITFDPNLRGTLALSGGNILISDSTTIQGPGASAVTIDANSLSQIFTIYPYTSSQIDVSISGLTLQHGYSTSNGGAISSKANLTLNQMVVQNSNATDTGGGLSEKEGAAGNANVIITNSTFTGNSAVNDGAFYVRTNDFTLDTVTISGNSATEYAGGASADVYGNMSMQNSTVSNNESGRYTGGLAVFGSGTVDVGSSSITGNRSVKDVAGLYLNGPTKFLHETTISDNHSIYQLGGLYLAGGTTLVTNVTIANNTAGDANHVSNGGGVAVKKSDIATFNFATITGNTATGKGGGLYVRYTGVAIINNSVISNNLSANGNNIYAANPNTIATFSLIGDSNGLVLATDSNNLKGVAAGLGTLQNNGGALQTELPSSTSPVLGAADPNGIIPATDERGVTRPTTRPADIGAVQLERCGTTLEGSSCTCTQACVSGCTCSAVGTCSGTPEPDGTACDDGNPATTNDTCHTGTCAGTIPSSGGTTGGGTTGGGTTGGTTTGGTTGTHSEPGSVSTTSKKSGCAAVPLDNLAPASLTLFAALANRLRRRRRASND